MLLIYAPEGGWDDVPPEAQEAEMAKWWTYSEEMKAAGVMVAGDALQPTATATSIRATDGQMLVTTCSNRSFVGNGPEAALPLVDALETDLGDYHLLHSARGDMLRRLGRDEDAVVAYRRALKLAPTESERRFLERRIGALTGA